MEGLDDKSTLTMFIEYLRANDLYINLRMDTPNSYSMAIKCANQHVNMDETLM